MARSGRLCTALWLACAGISPRALAEEPALITVQGEAPEGELASEPFAATSRVKRERLAAPGLRAADVLRSELGVQIVEAGGLGAPATASIRGATAAQTPVYLGSVRLNDLVGGVADLSTLPLWLIEHVDVYRGNAPLTAEQAIGGALFFQPRRPRRPEAGAGITGGSFGTRSGYGYLGVGDDRAGVLAGISSERAENDYEILDNRGTLFEPGDDVRRLRSNADSQLRDAWLVARARPSQRSRLELLVNDVSREQGAPKLALVPSRQARANLERRLAALSTRLQLDPAGQNVLELQTSVLQGSSELSDPERELGTLTERTRVRGRRGEQHAALELGLSESLSAALALNGSVESLQRFDDEQESSARAFDLGGAARLLWRPLAALSLFGVLSANCRSSQPGSHGCQNFQPTGRIGAGLKAPGSTWFFNLTRYQREPALGELYGAGIVVRGNPELRPELGLGADAGGRVVRRFRQVSLSGQLNAFLRSASDLVAYARTAQGYVVPLNIGAARTTGLELGASARALGHFELGCNATLLDARDTSEGRRLKSDILPFMSRLVLAPRLGLTSGALGRSLSQADLMLELNYLANRFADRAGLIVIPEQTTVNASGALSWLSGVLVTRARLSNALDTQRFDIVGYPLPGRSVFVSAEVKTP